MAPCLERFFNEDNKQAAAELAAALFGPSYETKGPCCPQCGGDTFRFIVNNRVRCMLCSNAGFMTMQEGAPVFKINKSEQKEPEKQEEKKEKRKKKLISDCEHCGCTENVLRDDGIVKCKKCGIFYMVE